MQSYKMFLKLVFLVAVLLLMLINPLWGFFALIGFFIGFIILTVVNIVRAGKFSKYIQSIALFVGIFVVGLVQGTSYTVFLMVVGKYLTRETSLSWILFKSIFFTIGIIICLTIFLIFYYIFKKYIGLVIIFIIGFSIGEYFASETMPWPILVPIYEVQQEEIRKPWIEEIKYSGSIIYFHKSNLWQINEEIQMDGERITKLLKILDRFNSSIQKQSPPSIDSIMSLYGWNSSGVINGKLRFTRQRKQPVSNRWFPVYSINTIFIPSIDYLGFFLTPDKESEILLEAPNNMVIRTYPQYLSRIELLMENKEQLTIPISLASEKGFSIRIQVLSPLFRNKLGHTLISVSIWSPIKWIVLALCLIFAEQIKKGILIPLVRKVFQFLKIPYFEDKKSDEM